MPIDKPWTGARYDILIDVWAHEKSARGAVSFPRISRSMYSAVLPSLGPCEVHTSLVTHGGTTLPDSHATECCQPPWYCSRHKWWWALALAPWAPGAAREEEEEKEEEE